MDVETWKVIWKLVFFAASLMFYAIVIAVGFKGFGDVTEMIRNMAAGRGASEVAADSEST
jgi:hypothetical protein